MKYQAAIHRREIVVILKHSCARNHGAELHVVAVGAEKDGEWEKFFSSELVPGRVFVCQWLLAQVEKLDEALIPAQMALHGISPSLGRPAAARCGLEP